MSVRVMTAIWDIDLPAAEKLVALKLADCASDDGGNAWPAVARIAHETGLSARKVQGCLKALQGRGLVAIQSESRAQRPTTYRFDLEALARISDPYTAPAQRAGVTVAGPPQDLQRPPQDSSKTPAQRAPKPSREPSLNLEGGASAPARPKKASRISEDWQPNDRDKAYAGELGLTPSQIEKTAENFRDYWLSVGTAKALKVDWSATWRMWCRRDAEKIDTLPHSPAREAAPRRYRSPEEAAQDLGVVQ